MFRNVSIRIKLLGLLLISVLITIMLLQLTSYFHGKKEEIQELGQELENIRLELMKSQRAQNEFLLHESINPDFFKKGESEFATLNDSLLANVNERLSVLADEDHIINMELDGKINHMVELQEEYRSTFNRLVNILLIRGFQNYGIEGEMREYSHELEDDFANIIAPADLLMLRRHEKDFIIRRQEKYLEKFNRQCETVKIKLLSSEVKDSAKVSDALELLDNYKATFAQLVASEKSIGDNHEGLKAEVDANARYLNDLMDDVSEDFHEKEVALLAEIQYYHAGGIILFIIISVTGSIIIARNMTRRLEHLSKNLEAFVKSDFKETSSYNMNKGKDEVGELAKNFKVLEDEIVIHFNHFRNKVEKRTEEILTQKEQLEKHKGVIERKNKDILDSIKYAKKIQDSILPERRFIEQLLPEHFILFQPKDIVSGDFYWIERSNNLVYIAVADCTGHGVPGAFMSIIGHNLLNQAVNEKRLEKPDQILNYLNIAMSNTLGQNSSNASSTSKIKDGMDISLLAIDNTNRKVMYSGAQRPLVVARDNELLEFKGDRHPVGGFLMGSFSSFTLHELDMQENDNYYLFSDGYSDQFGGERGKKFKYAKMKELLFSVRSEPMSTQRSILYESHELWKGNHEQVDDICVVGIKA